MATIPARQCAHAAFMMSNGQIAKYFFGSRPIASYKTHRTNNRGGRPGAAWYDVYTLFYADGQAPYTESITAARFNAKALCGCCGGRINLEGPKGCHCDYITCYTTDGHGHQLTNPSDGRCPKHHAQQELVAA